MQAHIFCIAAGLILAPSWLPAQWLGYPDPRIPKTAGGKPDLNAPAPRTADGKPDFSGIWETEKNRPCTPTSCQDMQAGQEFFNVAWSLKEGLPYQKWASDLVQARRATIGKDDPDIVCMPQSLTKMHTTPLMRKIIQTPGLLVILSERNATYRQIFTDGRPLEADPQPSWRGYSTGKWDKDSLVIETSGFRDDLWLDRNGNPLTSAAKITERFRRPAFGHMEIELTVDDPKAYTKPWTVKLNHYLVPNTDLLDYFCLENEKDFVHFAK
jgi:hypothetical protein